MSFAHSISPSNTETRHIRNTFNYSFSLGVQPKPKAPEGYHDPRMLTDQSILPWFIPWWNCLRVQKREQNTGTSVQLEFLSHLVPSLSCPALKCWWGWPCSPELTLIHHQGLHTNVTLVPLGWSHLLVCLSLKKAVLPRSFPFSKFPVFFLLHIQYPKPMPKITRMSLFVLPVIKDSFQDLLWVKQAYHQLSLKLL